MNLYKKQNKNKAILYKSNQIKLTFHYLLKI